MDFRIISIGAMSVNELWPRPADQGQGRSDSAGEPRDKDGDGPGTEHHGSPRSAHATTTLITAGGRHILVDPGLPAKVIAARLDERAGLSPDQITDVFLTCFRPEHRRGLAEFASARWLVAEQEREQVGIMLVQRFQSETNESLQHQVREEVALLQRFESAPDKLAESVDLFPLPGVTPGCAGLVLSEKRFTTLIAGPAVASLEHLRQGRIAPGAFDADKAGQSMSEVIEIADRVVPGYDNIVFNPMSGAWDAGPVS